jgi:hypothetical protein
MILMQRANQVWIDQNENNDLALSTFQNSTHNSYIQSYFLVTPYTRHAYRWQGAVCVSIVYRQKLQV